MLNRCLYDMRRKFIAAEIFQILGEKIDDLSFNILRGDF